MLTKKLPPLSGNGDTHSPSAHAHSQFAASRTGIYPSATVASTDFAYVCGLLLQLLVVVVLLLQLPFHV